MPHASHVSRKVEDSYASHVFQKSRGQLCQPLLLLLLPLLLLLLMPSVPWFREASETCLNTWIRGIHLS